jgi:hypothetical protein
MAEPFYAANVSVAPSGRLHRSARLPTGETIDMGVHGPVVGFYRLDPPRELPLPVDYIVAATGG